MPQTFTDRKSRSYFVCKVLHKWVKFHKLGRCVQLQRKKFDGKGPRVHCCLRPKAKDLGITRVVVVLGFFV